MSSSNKQNLEHVRLAIQNEFIRRCRKNSAYSLRAYARYLEIDQSFLSKLLKGQRPVTKNLAFCIAPKVGLKYSATNNNLSGIDGNDDEQFLRISQSEFEVISGWEHFAILELMKTKSYKNDAQSIAERLGLHVEEIRAALARLDQLGFIKLIRGKYRLLKRNNTWTNTATTMGAKLQLQKSLIEKSLYAIEHIPFDYRENGSLTVAIDRRRLPEFKEKLKKIRKELSEFMQPENENSLNEVYQLTMAFFPLSHMKFEQGDSK